MRWPFRPGTKQADHLVTGRWGEKHAAKFLKQKGYKILAHNVRIGRHDELDLIVRKKRNLIFVEVKTRSSSSEWRRPADAVNRSKRMRISRAAAAYTARLQEKPDILQFDIVEVVGSPKSNQPPEIRHVEDAFAAEGGVHLQW